MKKVILILVSMLTTLSVQSQDVTGQWFGALSIYGTQLRLVFNIAKSDNGFGCNSNCRLGVVASGMDNNPNLAFTEEEYVALARQKYNDLKALKNKLTFYDYEKSFEEIWLDLGRQVLKKSLSQVPNDRRKKKDDDPLRSNTHS